jgi:topoisomerase-4 subunit A
MIELEAGTRLIGYVAGTVDTPLLLATSSGHGFAACSATWCRGRKRASSSSRWMRVQSRWPRSGSMRYRSPYRVPLGEGTRSVFDAAEIRLWPAAVASHADGPRRRRDALAAVPIDRGALLRATRGSAGKPVEVKLVGALLEAQLGNRARKGKLVDSKLRPPFSLQRLAETAA